MNDEEKSIPWYLKKGWPLFFLAVTPPIGYLMVILNFKKMDKEMREDRLFWATLFAGMWSLKFLPRENVWSLVIIFLAFSFSTFLLFAGLLGRKK